MFAASRRVLVSVVTVSAVLVPAMAAQAAPAPTPIGRGDLRPQAPPPVLSTGPTTSASYTLLAPPTVVVSPNWSRAQC